MRLGVLVTVAAALDPVAGIVRAAAARGDEVRVFATDEGTRLLGEPGFAALAALPGVAVSYCAASAERFGPPPAGLPSSVRAASQYENSVMAEESDKLIVL